MIWLVALIFVLPFSLVLLYGAPYLPTRQKQAIQALRLLGLKKDELLVDLGCGDGAVLVQAAKQGIRGLGYEINPYIFMIAKVRTWRYRDLVTIKMSNYWNEPLPSDTGGVFVFLLDKYMARLDKKLSGELRPNTKLVSYSFEIPDKKIEKTVGPMHLYRY
jgi:SAM-dependent methyltransferase